MHSPDLSNDHTRSANCNGTRGGGLGGDAGLGAFGGSSKPTAENDGPVPVQTAHRIRWGNDGGWAGRYQVGATIVGVARMRPPSPRGTVSLRVFHFLKVCSVFGTNTA